MTVSKRGTESSSGQQQLTEDEWNELEDPLSEFFDQCATIQEDEVDDAPNAGGAKIPAICDTTRGDSETEKIIRAAKENEWKDKLSKSLKNPPRATGLGMRSGPSL